jgi:hypothetical protein
MREISGLNSIFVLIVIDMLNLSSKVIDKWILFIANEIASLVADGEMIYSDKKNSHSKVGSRSTIEPHISASDGVAEVEILRPATHSHSEELHRRELSDGIGNEEVLAVHLARLEVRSSHAPCRFPCNRLVQQELKSTLCKISSFMQQVFCEILLRDVEYLLCRYLKKMRKNITRMHWDDDSKTSPLGFDRADSSMTDF